MYKPKSLRKALTDAVPDLARNPEMMRIFIDNGKLASTLAASLSFENQYTLNVVVTDFTGDIELLLVPIQAWLRIHQADIMTTDEGRKRLPLFCRYQRQRQRRYQYQPDADRAHHRQGRRGKTAYRDSAETSAPEPLV